MTAPGNEEMEEDQEVVKKFMNIIRRAPHGTIYTYEALEMILIMGAFEQDISVAFIDDGVYALVKNQDTSEIGIKGFSNTFRALDGYDIEKLYVDRESMEERGLTEDDLVVGVEVVSSEELGNMMKEQDVLVPH
ncbi:MAG: sulfurtransferase complex subunit TusC [Deltaproteobacteria bacterium]|nr:sulfurtransferase complex subunit TusC [Deltaproteobacteria bacterium]